MYFLPSVFSRVSHQVNLLKKTLNSDAKMKFPLILAAFVPLTAALTNVIGDVKVDVDVQNNDILSNSVKATNDRNQNEPVDLPPQPQKQPVETKPQLPNQTKGFELPTKFPFFTFPLGGS